MNELTPDEHNIIVDAIHDSATVIHKGQRMNERIKQFAELSGFKVDWQHEDVQALKMARFEKFTELIVRECIDTAFHKGHPDLEFLLKHFGVEE